MQKSIVIFYSDTLSSHLLYSRIINEHPELISCLIRFPVIPRRQASQQKNEPMFFRIMKRSSWEFLFFNFCIVVVYRVVAWLFGKRFVDLAKTHNIPEHYFHTIDEECIKKVSEYHPAWIFNNSPNLLKKNILNVPTLGTLNYHAAPLPEYRGEGNYFWVLFEKEKTAKATLHYVTEKLDAGDIIMYSEGVYIREGMSVFELWCRLRVGAHGCFKKILPYCEQPQPIPATPQDESRAGVRSFPGKEASREIQRFGHPILQWSDFWRILTMATTGTVVQYPADARGQNI